MDVEFLRFMVVTTITFVCGVALVPIGYFLCKWLLLRRGPVESTPKCQLSTGTRVRVLIGNPSGIEGTILRVVPTFAEDLYEIDMPPTEQTIHQRVSLKPSEFEVLK